jgi:hypothetical protein
MKYSERFNDMRNEFIKHMVNKSDPFSKEEQDLRSFEKDLQYIYFGKILDSGTIKDYIQLHFDSVRDRPNDFTNDFLHIYKMDNELLIQKGEEKEILRDLYKGTELYDKEIEIFQNMEREMVEKEAYKDKTFLNLNLKKKVDEYYLREGLPVGMLKLKDNIKLDKVEAQELIDLLNYNDLEYQYEAVRDDLDEFYLIKKLRGFRFNVGKYLYFLEEKDKLAEEICKVIEVPFEDYLRLEMGLRCSTQQNEQKIRKQVLSNQDYLDGIRDLENEFFGKEELKLIKSLSQDVIDEEILVYKSHILMRSRLGKLEKENITRPIRQRDIVTNATGKVNSPDYDILINN